MTVLDLRPSAAVATAPLPSEITYYMNWPGGHEVPLRDWDHLHQLLALVGVHEDTAWLSLTHHPTGRYAQTMADVGPIGGLAVEVGYNEAFAVERTHGIRRSKPFIGAHGCGFWVPPSARWDRAEAHAIMREWLMSGSWSLGELTERYL